MKLLRVLISCVILHLMITPVIAGTGQDEAGAGLELGTVEVAGERERISYSRSIVSDDEIAEENPTDTGDMLKKFPEYQPGGRECSGWTPFCEVLRRTRLMY